MYMEDVKLFAKNEEKLETPKQTVRIYSDDKRMEYGIEKCAMLIMKSGKRQKTEGRELSNEEKVRTFGEKEHYKYLGKLEGDTIKQVEKKSKKNTSGERENYSKPNYIAKISWKDCTPCKILGTIFKVDERRTLKNGPKNKKINDDAWGL